MLPLTDLGSGEKGGIVFLRGVQLPLPTLLVTFVTLSLTPKTVFLTKLAAPWLYCKHPCDLTEALTYLG